MNVEVVIGWGKELVEFKGEIFLDGRFAAIESRVGAAESAEGGDAGHGAEGSLSKLELAEIGEGGVLPLRSHGESVANKY